VQQNQNLQRCERKSLWICDWFGCDEVLNSKNQTHLLTLFLFLITLQVHSVDGISDKSILKDGVSLGSIVAAAISWDRNKSILLVIVHEVMSWIYVIYVNLTRE
jgi:hypothetical protein